MSDDEKKKEDKYSRTKASAMRQIKREKKRKWLVKGAGRIIGREKECPIKLLIKH